MSIILRTDVTSVKFHKNFVLAGIGSFVNVYDKSTTNLLCRIQALEGQKIYGFMPSVCGQKILVFGGKQFTLLSLEASDAHVVVIRCFKPVLCDDWLHSALWVDENAVAILTAHNNTQHWNIIKQSLLCHHQSADNSILYSGLLVPLKGDVLVLAGTVFSEVIIHHCKGDKPLHHLKGHRGVIFSISCEPQKGIIVTTSDDRSVRIWSINNPGNHVCDTVEFWEKAGIVCKHEVYGHTARVMRSCITSDNIVSVGEDSAVCFWDLEGNLLRKLMSHQNGCVWSVDNDEAHLVTGGGDCGIILHPLSVISEYGQNETLDLDVGTPKKVLFTSRRNLVILNEHLVFYDIATKSKMTYKLNHESTYKLLSISSCKQLIAVTDMYGKLDVFAENCKDTAYLQNIINTNLQIGKILSMQWAGNRHLVFCSENGAVTVLASMGNKTEKYADFLLPPCKERWLTACALNSTNNIFVFGDRCGSIHVYVKVERNPIKTISKVHGRYGPTSITIRNNEIVTTGRDGAIKYFCFNQDSAYVKYMLSKDLQLHWVEKFLDKNENIICGFQERNFVVYDLRTNSKLLELNCGGGHRAWDAIRYIEKLKEDFEETIRLVYLKNSEICMATFHLSKLVSKNIVNGSHCKEINCLIALSIDQSLTFYITGGEDTTLRISSINSQLEFHDEMVFKQLSNIRTLRAYPLGNEEILLLSAGGRAQICVKTVTLGRINGEVKISSQEVTDYLIKGTDKERKGNQTWRNCSVDFDPETRIMNLDLFKINDSNFIVFAGCSDAYLRVFKLAIDSKNVEFKPVKELKHHETCILKTNCLKFFDRDILVTCTTRGEITFWSVTDTNNMHLFNVKAVFTISTNKSGINCFASRILSDTSVLIACGGDDNSIHLKVVEILDQCNLDSMRVTHSWFTDKLHSSQITGLCLLDDVLISASIDQRVTLCRWVFSEDGLECQFISQTFSDVADIQGLDVLESSEGAVTVCVFGKGIEVLTMPTSS